MSDSYSTALVNNILHEFQNKNKEAAFKKMSNYIKMNPKDYIAVYNFALMAETIGKINLAIENYLKVIKKERKNWQSRFNLYIIYIKQKKYEKALPLVNEVLQIYNKYQPALRDKALIYYYLGKPDKGIPYIEEAIELNEKDYIAINILGLILGSIKLHEKAREVFEKAININPKYFASYNNLGNCLNILKKQDLALKNFEKAIELNPNFQEAINNIANIYSVTGNYKKAIKYYKEALKKGDNTSNIYYNIGVAYSYLNDLTMAEKYYNISYKINPHDQILIKNFSILFLAKQEYEKAWKLFDGRLNLDDFVEKNSTINNIRKKLWKGEKIKSSDKILIIKEQGIGDEILYSSMYPDLLKKFPDSKIETENRLISIFQKSFGYKNNFVPFFRYSKNTNEIKKFDKILYAGSLGRLFRNKISDFPNKNFLYVDNSIIKKIRKKIDTKNKFNVGITWKSKREIIGEDKSINLQLLDPILQIKNINFINLQYGDTKKEITQYNKSSANKIINIKDIDLFNDFNSIAGLLNNLDIFITISNSTAHLAGALGIKTWLIKPKNHALFHYWNQPKNKTPWYPSIRLFNYEDNWATTIEKIKKLLIKELNIKN